MTLALVLLVVPLACNVQLPVDPSEVLAPIDELVNEGQRGFERAVADPLDIDPFPIVIGGSSAKVYYATNLADVRIDFPGRTTDLVIPGFFAPSNLYEIDLVSKRRNLIRPLVPVGAGGLFISDVVTDGAYFAYLSSRDALSGGKQQLYAGALADPNLPLIIETGVAATFALFVGLDDGRLVYVVANYSDDSRPRLVIHDLVRDDDGFETDDVSLVAASLRGPNLVYAECCDAAARIVLVDLSRGESTVIADAGPGGDLYVEDLYVTDNSVVWSEMATDETLRISAYDIPSGETRVWADAVVGRLTGASDEFFLTEDLVERWPQAKDKIVIRRHDLDGTVHKLAEFRNEGWAGQSTILGDRAVWVNPARKIILAPLAGGGRMSFAPF